ncbi:Predicted DNA-binding protein, MmcQ/YjbR family [Ruminococcaceae bacterium YRB3002]|nr:Predicted DNA-binding protein, MmcQ/YjbR family [Ruminococcaceae bacterium YRB3002]
MRQRVNDYIMNQYGVAPEFPWQRYDDNAVYRHAGNRKWFALIMDVQRGKLGLEDSKANAGEKVSVINLKIVDVILRDMIIHEPGIMPAYHMNKMHWITVLLDGTVPEARVHELIELSYQATAPKKHGRGSRSNSASSRGRIEPKEWIIPANPKYYDVEGALAASDEITWKQGSGIIKGDIVYMYVGAPVSAILYKCEVLETDIPYDYIDKNLTITALMRIRLLRRYGRREFTFERLKDEFGIFAVRGPRGVPYSLSAALNNGKDQK